MYGSIKDDFRNAWNRPNNVVSQLIIINVAVFVIINLLRVFLFFGSADTFYPVLKSFLALPSNLNTLLVRPWTLVSYMFTHESFFHILFNMLWLYWFGRLIQEYLGGKKVLAIYVMGGLAGGLLYLLIYNIHPFFEGVVTSATLIGASAGTTALIVGAAAFMPNFTMYLLLLGPVKIKYIAAVVVFLSIIGTTGSNAGGEFAHLGGAFMGWLYISQVRKGNDIGAWVLKVTDFLRDLFRPQPKIRVSHRSKPKAKTKATGGRTSRSTATRSESTSQEEIDAILDKISQSGYESLSKEEKQKLFNASK
jgi:membrane associated rhomboid family serine protease